MERLEERRDEILGRLADSINKKKSKERNRIASKIEEYIENEYNGWECGRGSHSDSGRSRSGRGSAFLFQPWESDTFTVFMGGELFSLEEEAIEASAKRHPAGQKEKPVKSSRTPWLKDAVGFLKGLFSFKGFKGEAQNEGSLELKDLSKLEKTKSPIFLRSVETSSWTEWFSLTGFDSFHDVASFFLVPSVFAEEIPADESKSRTLSEMMTVEDCRRKLKDNSFEPNLPDDAMVSCPTQGGGSDTGIRSFSRNICPGNGESTAGCTCQAYIHKDKCYSDCSKFGKVLSKRENVCISKEEGCAEKDQVYSQEKEECVTKKSDCEKDTTKKWVNGKCITKKENCEKDTTKKWVNGKCITKKENCEKDTTKKWVGGKCITKKENCEKDTTKKWVNGKCITKKENCEKDTTKKWVGGKCITKKENCEKDTTKKWVNGKCITKKENCEKDTTKKWVGGKCITKKENCEKDTTKKWVNGKCITKKENCEKDTTKKWVGGKCITKKEDCEKDTTKKWVGGKCITKKENCEKDTTKKWVGGKCITNKENCEKDTTKKWVGGKCITNKENCEKDTTKKWVGGKCITKKEDCEKDTTKKWVGGKCITKKENCEKDTTKKWVNGKCITKKENCEKDTTKKWVGGKCITKAHADCLRANNVWVEGSGCFCKSGNEVSGCKCEGQMEPVNKGVQEICVQKCSEARKETRNPEGTCVACPKGKYNKDWQNDPAFGRKGSVHPGFCNTDRYGANSRDCKRALKDLKNILKKLAELQKKRDNLDEKLFNLEMADDGDKEDKKGLESSGLCFECVQELRALNRPSGWHNFGNILSLGLGGALSVFGIREGRRAAAGANEMLALQGFPAQNHLGYSMAGASLGFPFIGNGLHGLSQANASQGGYNCSPTVSPHAHSYPYMSHSLNPYSMF